MDKKRRYFNTGGAGRDFSTLVVTLQSDDSVRLQVDGEDTTGLSLILSPEQIANVIQFMGGERVGHEPPWEDVAD